MQSRQKGMIQETLAADYLMQRGVQIVERNFRCRQGEIDLIGTHRSCLVFFEVKYRRNTTSGTPEEAVGLLKQQKICRVSDYYMLSHSQWGVQQVRYDVVAILGKQIHWYQDAFSYQNRGYQYLY